jgi:hypothetical protein
LGRVYIKRYLAGQQDFTETKNISKPRVPGANHGDLLPNRQAIFLPATSNHF